MLRQIQALILKNFQLLRAGWLVNLIILFVIPLGLFIGAMVYHIDILYFDHAETLLPRKQEYKKSMGFSNFFSPVSQIWSGNGDLLCEWDPDGKYYSSPVQVLDTRSAAEKLSNPICVSGSPGSGGGSYPTRGPIEPVTSRDEFDEWFINIQRDSSRYHSPVGLEFHENDEVVINSKTDGYFRSSFCVRAMFELAKRHVGTGSNYTDSLFKYHEVNITKRDHTRFEDSYYYYYSYVWLVRDVKTDNAGVNFVRFENIHENYRKHRHMTSHGLLVSIIVVGLNIITISIVMMLQQERKDKVLTLMRLNGLTLTEYLLANVIFWTLIGIIQVILLYILLLSFWHPLVSYSAIIIPTLILHVLSCATLAPLLNLVIPQNAFGLLVILQVVSAIAFTGAYWYPETKIHHGAFYLIPLSWTSVIFAQCYYMSVADTPVSEVLNTSSLKAAFGMQFCAPIVYFLLSYYFYHLSKASGSESRKDWYFPLVALYRYTKKFFSGKEVRSKEDSSKAQKLHADQFEQVISSQDATSDIILSTSEIEPSSLLVSADGRAYTPIIDNQEVDPDVKREAERAFKVTSDTHPLIVRKVTKTYDDGKTAVSDVSFAMENGIVFGLLGPNGAGKSTLINAMSGVHKHSSGEIIIAGYDMDINLQGVLDNIGYCPQHDIHWSNLTVAQHLLLFLRLKGIPPGEEYIRLEQLLTLVSMNGLKDRLASKLSGGEKRRLSIAMAFCGRGKVIFLDEPTTGLDPEVRKFVWNVISEVKKDRMIVLTTHSMEEAELLSDKIAIMALGTLRCFGTPQYLKAKYGGKTIINVSATKDILVHVISAIIAIRRDQISIVSQSYQTAKLEYSGPKESIPDIYDAIEDVRTKMGFEDWGFDQPSLSEVFIRIVSEAEAGAV